MKEMRNEIEYKGTKYVVVFNINVMEAIQEEYGTIQNWGDLTEGKSGEADIKAIVFGLTEMINEGIDIQNEEKVNLVKRIGLQPLNFIDRSRISGLYRSGCKGDKLYG